MKRLTKMALMQTVSLPIIIMMSAFSYRNFDNNKEIYRANLPPGCDYCNSDSQEWSKRCGNDISTMMCTEEGTSVFSLLTAVFAGTALLGIAFYFARATILKKWTGGMPPPVESVAIENPIDPEEQYQYEMKEPCLMMTSGELLFFAAFLSFFFVTAYNIHMTILPQLEVFKIPENILPALRSTDQETARLCTAGIFFAAAGIGTAIAKMRGVCAIKKPQQLSQAQSSSPYTFLPAPASQETPAQIAAPQGRPTPVAAAKAEAVKGAKQKVDVVVEVSSDHLLEVPPPPSYLSLNG